MEIVTIEVDNPVTTQFVTFDNYVLGYYEIICQEHIEDLSIFEDKYKGIKSNGVLLVAMYKDNYYFIDFIHDELYLYHIRNLEWVTDTPILNKRYLVYRQGCDKVHFENYQNGWEHNNDITHWVDTLSFDLSVSDIGMGNITWKHKDIKPNEYGKYFVLRETEPMIYKVEIETWNGSGWAYNSNSILYWSEIIRP